ncbi:toxin co-regulated pilus biosynthesis Q family protein [Acidithiobacillus acidisediminis]|jgi:hypothetical protein|uniref:toxin co-regulated pilus biosynthesis Q family protein n=1 Tax=Acidithiobacillus acidisediminis TaxID=2937799 RepID=UPI00200DC079|nr:toxin co-regulated pilus biosynthesis Q family protein [Acidithiobacillus sp. S30A2]
MYQFLVPPLRVATPPAITVSAPPPGPDLSGFRKSLETQPTLAVHGFGVAHAAKNLRKGTVTVRAALRQTLPAGWKVYSKPGVSLQFPIVVMGSMVKEHWTQALREELRQAGLHGALWWNQQILTLWTPPVERVPVTVSAAPKLAGYQQEKLSPASAMPQQVTEPLPSSGHLSESLPPNFHVGPASVVAMPSLAGASPVFVLNRGDLILTDLEKWAEQSGWTVVWQVPEDWTVPNTTTFSGGFRKAVSQVIQALSANGANVHAVFHTANNTVVISGAGGGE